MSRSFTGLMMIATLLVAPWAHAGGDAGHGFDLSIHGFYVVDFLAYLALMGLLFRKPARSFLENRYESARMEMEAASSLKETAESRLDKYEGLLGNLDDEIAALEAEFRKDGEGEQVRIQEATDTAAEKIRRDGARTLSREQTQLREGMEEELVLQALSRAEELVKDRLDQGTQQALIRSFIDHLEEKTTLSSS